MSPSQHVQLHVQIHFTCEALRLPSNYMRRRASRVALGYTRVAPWSRGSFTVLHASLSNRIRYDTCSVAISAVQYCEGQLTLLL